MTDNCILVTGGAGAIGSNLVAHLIDSGYRVAVIDDLSSGRRELVHKKANFYPCSVSEMAAVENVFQQEKPSYVFHLAAFFANQNSVDHPQRDLAVNGGGTINVLQCCQKYKVKKLVYSSSSCVYGNMEVMTEEATLPRVLDTPYAISKLLGESYCHFWHDYWKLNVSIVRIFNCFGPGELPGKYRNVIPNFFKLALEGKPLPITGTGDESRDFNFVLDIVGAMVSVLHSDKTAGEIINLSSGVETSIKELALKINQLTGNDAGLCFKSARSWDKVTRRVGDNQKLLDLTQFNSKYSIDDGLKLTYDWLKEQVCAKVY